MPGQRLVHLLAVVVLVSCGEEEPTPREEPSPGWHDSDALGELAIDYPLDETVFPPEFVPPTFLWHDPDPESDTWIVEIEFSDPKAKSITVEVPGDPPPKGELDMDAFGETNEPYEGTAYQKSARSWTPPRELWERVKRSSRESTATVRITGFAKADPETPLSKGTVRILTSKDPVGAPIFYRDVPLMPSVGTSGVIKPLSDNALPLIAWRLRDVSRPDSKLVLKGMSSCGNCHSFSLDGKTLGMDVDGPNGDKGMYAIKPVSKEMVIDYDDVITWNSFPGKPENHRTIGFLSRISPDGSYVVSTVNESVYVSNFADHEFLQVFYPTGGILAYYSRAERKMRALPGADDPEYVHCGAVWSPDGSQLVFMRARARDVASHVASHGLPKHANDPNEFPMQYSLYRIPFDGGKGGKPVPIEGASDNGMSNTFPKVSPDGKWIVFTQCKNGMLMRPDSRLWIVPFEGGEAREMRCNTKLMNSWHSFSPNGRWLVFSSKSNTPYTQAFLTHIDENGNDSPAILVPNCTAANRAVNLPEFLNASFDGLDTIVVPAIRHHIHFLAAERHLKAGRFDKAVVELEKALDNDPTFVRALVALGYSLMGLGRFGAALQCLDRAIAEDPRQPDALFNFAFSSLQTGRPNMAIRALEKLVVISPSFPDAGKHLADARQKAKDLQVDIEACEREVSRRDEDPKLRRRLSDLYRRAGRPEDSVKQLVRAVGLKPDDPVGVSKLAWMLATSWHDDIRDGARAVLLAERAVRMTKARRPEPLYILAASYAEVGRYKDAVVTAERALLSARQTNPALLAKIEIHLKRYRKGQPIRTAPDR
ncbi:MAG: tetratricopeptide repeat protein [Planctomycetota bacterium]|jgi:tetratricopeptide (TPR) repeat protein